MHSLGFGTEDFNLAESEAGQCAGKISAKVACTCSGCVVEAPEVSADRRSVSEVYWRVGRAGKPGWRAKRLAHAGNLERNRNSENIFREKTIFTGEPERYYDKDCRCSLWESGWESRSLYTAGK